jgi:seryl-tRNA(Sec) selenium transferase
VTSTTTPPERGILNAAATLTRLGGSLMAPEVVAAMAGAAGRYVDLPAEYKRVGARIAELTGNEAAAVTAGAAAALTLTVASAITGPVPASLKVFPWVPRDLPNHVVMLAPQRNEYDYAVEMLGVTIVECDANAASFRAAIVGDRVACVLWFAGSQYPAPGLSLDEIVTIAAECGVPVIVDAAAQVPSVRSFREYTQGAGAAAAIFSGGKGIAGPQTTGFVMGSTNIVAGVLAHASPNHGVGRAMKVGKEELAGALAALERTLAVNEVELLARYEAVVDNWIVGLTDLATGAGSFAPLESIKRTYPSEAGQPHSRAELTTVVGGPSGAELAAQLWESTPRVAVLVTGPRSISLNPQPLEAGDEVAVLRVVRATLDNRTGPPVDPADGQTIPSRASST